MQILVERDCAKRSVTKGNRFIYEHDRVNERKKIRKMKLMRMKSPLSNVLFLAYFNAIIVGPSSAARQSLSANF
jgi:hypothetical protein